MRTNLMKATVLSLLSSSTLFIAAPSLAADSYKLDPSHTAIVWQVSHFGFSSPSGKFMNVDGSVLLDESKPENSSVNVTIKTVDVVTGVAKLDTHLKTKDFFDTDAFPTATFVSTKVTKTGKDTAKVEGNFTLLAVTKPIVLDVKLNKIAPNMMKVKTAGFTASTQIKRSDFGMNSYLPGVGDEVKINIESEANLVVPPQPRP